MAKMKIFGITVSLFFLFTLTTIASCKNKESGLIDAKVEFITNFENFPAFSWKSAHGKTQLYSQILVSGKRSNVQNNIGDLWDTGKKALNPIHTKYQGAKLTSGNRYFVKIRSWNEDGSVSNKILQFFAPLNYPQNWNAKWLTYDYKEEAPLPVFAKVFNTDIENEIEFARLYVCAPGFYEVYLNGEKVGENVLDPVQTNYEDYTFYSAYTIQPEKIKNKNSLGMMLGNGWYNQNQVWGKGLPYGQPVFICQLQIQYKNGDLEIVGSDPSWLWKNGPISYSNIYGGETYDANSEVDFSVEGIESAKDWKNSMVALNHPTNIYEQFADPIQKMGTVKVKTVTKLGNGKFVFDFGQNFTGWTKLKIEGKKGQEITIRFAEEIDSNGNLDPTSTGVEATKVVQTCKYFCKGEGVEIWEPRFTYHGFRYAELTGLNEAPSFDLLTGIEVYSSMAQAGSFHCSEENINKLHDLALWTIKGNIQGIPTDCPHRERCGWTGDAHALAQNLFYNFDAHRFFTKYMLDMRSSAREEKRELYFGESFHDRSFIQKPKGIPTMIVPGKRTSGTASPDWGTAMVQIPWYLYLFYGDENILEEFYPDMKTWVEFVHAKNEDGIIMHGLGDWCPPGGNSNIECPVPVSSSAFHILDVSIMKQVADKLGRTEDSQRYSKMLGGLKQSFNSHFYDVENQTFGSQTADAMALEIGTVPEENKRKVAAAIVKNIHDKHDGFISTGIFGIGRIFKALCENGCEEEAYRLLSKKDNKSFATMWNYFDATTLWEVLPVDSLYDKTFLNGRSHSHPMQAGYDSWFYSGIAGINCTPENPGFKTIVFKPYLTNFLTSASASYESPYGTVISKWKSGSNGFSWEIEIPSNCSGKIYLPQKENSSILNVNGKNQAIVELPIDEKFPGFWVLGEWGSGSYKIELK